MTDDISEIPTTGCNYISSPTVIYNYNNNQRRTYKQIGGKWFYTDISSYNTLPSSAICSDISNISSNSVYLPIYYFIAFCLVAVTILLWFNVFRRVIRWRL